jgi:hypothetical protein
MLVFFEIHQSEGTIKIRAEIVSAGAVAMSIFCASAPATAQALIFADGFESGDATAWANFGPEVCNNWIDDDGDSFVDCDDFNCSQPPVHPACQ